MSEPVVTGEDRSRPGGSAGPGPEGEPPAEHLRGRVGATAIVATVMAFLAPLGAAAGYIPIVIGYGNGLGAPLIFLFCGVILVLFSFGFLAMVRQVPRPGAFYAYITAGLGKQVGLGAGALTLVFYVINAVGFTIFGGLSLSAALESSLGATVPWWVCVGLMTVVVAFCSYRGVDFNVRVLGVIVLVEVLVLTLFDVVALVRGVAAPAGLTAEPLTWGAFTSGSIAVAVLFAIAFFVGFESTAIYREEVRDPVRTIPRATYAVTAIIAGFYFVTAYCLIVVLGPANAVSATGEDPSGSFRTAFESTLGHAFTQIVSVMVVTSVLAAQLAMANAITRYLYSFGVDRVLPATLGAVHPRYGSPHRAAVVTNILTVVVVLLVVVTGLDPQKAYATFSGVSTFAFEALLILVSLAAIVYFRRNPGTGESVFNTVIAPALSIVAFGWLLVLGAARAELLLGTPTLLIPVLFVVLVGAFVVGLGYAIWAATHKPDVFARIGRTEG